MEKEKDLLQSKIEETQAKLPKASLEAIGFVDWKNLLSQIGKRNKYNPEQLSDLEMETELLLSGLMNPNNYPKELEERLAITSKDAEILINEINRTIFEKIKEKLIELINIKGENKIDKDYKQKIYEIGAKYRLPIDKMGEVEVVTGRFINGEISSTQYENSLSLITELPESKITEIIKDINEQIVKEIRSEVINDKPYVSSLIEKEVSGTPQASNLKENIEDEIPLPPYKKESDEKNTNDEIPLPPYKKESGKSEVVSDKQEQKNYDLYREHGIEILDAGKEIINNEELRMKNEKKVKEIKNDNFAEIMSQNSLLKHEAELIIEKKETPVINILADKLTRNTASTITVSDYSLPKINPQIQPMPTQGGTSSKPHDPYHEAI